MVIVIGNIQLHMASGNITVPVAHGEKSEKFDGANFKQWQRKMLFYLTTLQFAKFLKETPPGPVEGEPEATWKLRAEAWLQGDFLCKNYLLGGLDNTLYNVYQGMASAKSLWESLEKKYKTEDAGQKKFVVGRFLDYKMVDSRTVMSQLGELQLIIHEILDEGMKMCETFQVATIIEKLPPSWKEFRSYLKHKKKQMSLEDLSVRLRIEEDNKMSEKASYKTMESNANIIGV